MNKASQSIALVLVPLSIIYLGYRGCERDGGYASTRSSSGGGGRSYWGSGSGSSSSGDAHSSGTSRGGFGFFGGSGS